MKEIAAVLGVWILACMLVSARESLVVSIQRSDAAQRDAKNLAEKQEHMRRYGVDF